MNSTPDNDSSAPARSQRMPYVPVVGPRLRRLLAVVFGLFALLVVNSVYLAAVSVTQWITGQTWETYFFQWMFLVHLVLGLAIVIPIVLFGTFHIRNAWSRPNRRAVRAGLALFTMSIVVLVTGILLTRAFVDLRRPDVRAVVYWAHVIGPLVVVWLFILHRLAGTRIRWRTGLTWAAVAGVVSIALLGLHSRDPRGNPQGPDTGLQYFFPSLARTASGAFIPKRVLLNDQYCQECHADIHEHWNYSVHHLSSFSNPAYNASVRQTREVVFARDGNVQASRFCAGCHDPVPFFSGEFEDPRFDEPGYDPASDPLAGAGITCTSCHSIVRVNSVRGNADYTIEEPIHYPFTFSDNPVLSWVNRQLVKSNPGFHKKTFLKPLHKTAEFCGSCHKVHLPEELNAYKFLRGQNHYDAFLLSGVSGHGVSSFYYPARAEANCNGCHMPLQVSDDFGARFVQTPGDDLFGELVVHDHQFPSANTAVPYLLDMPPWVNEAHRAFLDGVMRVDIFGVRDGGTINGPLTAPIGPEAPTLEPGRRYLLETVIRTLKMGHVFTQGTADSNEVWLDVTLTGSEGVIGRSGGRGPDGEVDPWSHFVNSFVLDTDGNRIDRRNAQDIFVALYNHQIPPGAADVVHFSFTVPPDATGAIIADVKLQYRKFDTTYMRFFQGPDEFDGNDLPVITLAHDTVTFKIGINTPGVVTAEVSTPGVFIPLWERWHDYGIGLLRKGGTGELRQAEAAFAEVGLLGRPEGPLGRARVYFKEGRLDDAVTALQAGRNFDPPAYPWTVAWFTGLVNKQNGYLDEAIANFSSIVDMDTAETRRRDLDFSRDYRLLNELGQTLFERAKQERGDAASERRRLMMIEAAGWFERVLKLDPENVTAHYNLALLAEELGEPERAQRHRSAHGKFKPDDNARDRAVAAARIRYPAANHAAEPVVIYDLQREDAYELSHTPVPGSATASRRP
ncbi:MAG: tetratricopeptide repeat protein [Planctomycetota bacterium]|nr:MAG: tetratricopeptide repeat protein [Planctomycetota bacterium]